MDRKPATDLISFVQQGGREQNRNIARETIEILNKKVYRINNRKVDLCLKTGIYDFEQAEIFYGREQAEILKDTDQFMKKSFYEPEEHKIEILSQDALFLAQDYFRPFILVPVNYLQFGNELMEGSNSLEADYMRRSSLFAALSVNTRKNFEEREDIHEAVLLIEKAAVFRDDSNQLMEHPYPVSFMCAEPVMIPEKNRGFLQDPAVIEPMKKKIRSCLMIAARKMFRNLILCPFGYPDAGHTNEAIAAYFYSILVEEHYQEYFEKIIFAIPEWMGEQTCEAFKRTFLRFKKLHQEEKVELKMMSDQTRMQMIQFEYPFPVCNYITKHSDRSHLAGFAQGVFLNGIPYAAELFFDNYRKLTSVTIVLPFFEQYPEKKDESMVKKISEFSGKNRTEGIWPTVLCRDMEELTGYNTEELLLAYLDFLVLSGGIELMDFAIEGSLHVLKDFAHHKAAAVSVVLNRSGQVMASVPYRFFKER